MHHAACSAGAQSSWPTDTCSCIAPQKEEAEKELAPLAEAMKAALGDRVERVVVSRRLADSPVALVTSKFGWSANMERIMKTQVCCHLTVLLTGLNAKDVLRWICKCTLDPSAVKLHDSFTGQSDRSARWRQQQQGGRLKTKRSTMSAQSSDPLHTSAAMSLLCEQAMGDNRAMEYMRGRRILEINPDSPVISALRARLESDPAGVAPTAELLYETALITGGFTVDSPKDFANRCLDSTVLIGSRL